MLTDIEFQTIKDRLAKATPGPWEMHHRFIGCGPGDDERGGLGWDFSYDGNCPPDPQRGLFARWADATFVEHAHTDIAALIAEVEQLRAIIAANPVISKSV